MTSLGHALSKVALESLKVTLSGALNRKSIELQRRHKRSKKNFIFLINRTVRKDPVAEPSIEIWLCLGPCVMPLWLDSKRSGCS